MAAKKGKFVLVIGDEGGILVYFQGAKVIRRLFAATPNYADTRAFQECLESDPAAPIYMLVDVMDQSYIQQSLPPVSSLSINNLIKRKMERDFAPDDLKGALQIGREKTGRRDWKYLFVTLNHSPQLQAWLELIIELPNRFSGIYLLPVEAEHFARLLEDALHGKKSKKKAAEDNRPLWQLLVTHNKVGGFRQVVLRDGKLIFARLAQPIGDSKPEVIAGGIEQEISVTIEYLKRLGYTEDQGLSLYVVTSETIRNAIDAGNLHVIASHLYTPYEVAEQLGLGDVAEPADQYADVVLSAAFAKNKKHLLRLETSQSEKLRQLYTYIMGVKMGGAVVTLGALGFLLYQGIMVPAVQGEIEEIKRKTVSAQEQLTRTRELQKELPDDLEKITDLVSMHQQLSNLGLTSLEALEAYSRATAAAQVQLREWVWDNKDPLLTSASAPPSATHNSGRGRAARGDSHEHGGSGRSSPSSSASNIPAGTLKLKIGIDMYETHLGTEQFNVKAREFTAAMQQAFTDYKVTLNAELPGIQENERLQVGLKKDDTDPLLQQPSYALEYIVEGPVSQTEDGTGQGGNG